jgi:hypothetical protein
LTRVEIALHFLIEQFNSDRFRNHRVNIIKGYIQYLKAQIKFMRKERLTLAKYRMLSSE